jgi:dTDP-4-amino-4,6-dideoxygalactose transaminase
MHGINGYDMAGSNVRMSELDCATLHVKAKYIDTWQKKRKNIAEYWLQGFKEHKIRVILDSKSLDSHALHKFVIDIDNRDKVRDKLANKLIETRIHYEHPLHELNKFHMYKGPDLISKASVLSRRVLSLPLYPELTDLEVEYIMESVIKCVTD